MMNPSGQLIDLASERGKRIHDLHDKRLEEMRRAFEQALPTKAQTSKGKSRTKAKPKKKR